MPINRFMTSVNMANTYLEMNELERAQALYHRAYKIADANDFAGRRESSLSGLLQIFEKTEQYDSTFIIGSQLLALSQTTNDIGYQATAIHNLLSAALATDSPKTNTYAQQAEAINQEELPNAALKWNLSRSLAYYYLSTGQYERANDYVQRGVDENSNTGTDTTLAGIKRYRTLAEIQQQSGRHRAAALSYERLYALSNALHEQQRDEAIADLAVKQNLAENELARQQAEQATLLAQEANAERTRWFGIVLAMVALVLGILWWAYRRAQRDKQLISAQNRIAEQSLAEKEVLLREIHHRVKNNLQIISSLLDKQARKSSDSLVQQLMKEGQERIHSMALVHQNLYQSEGLSGIDVKSYLHELTANIQNSQTASTEHVSLQLDIAEAQLDIDTAIPVGLIMNELITNCYKYAFPEEQPGKISVNFRAQEGANTSCA